MSAIDFQPSVGSAPSSSGSAAAETCLTGEIEVLESRLLRREEELAAARRENLSLRTSQMMLEAELRSAETDAHADSDAAQFELNSARRSLSESRVNAGAVSTELRHEESMRETVLAEAAAQRAVVTAEIGLFELASRAQEDFSRQQALTADAERALVTAELDTTERNLAAATAHAVRVLSRARAAEEAAANNGAPPELHVAAEATSASAHRSRNDGTTQAEAATGPSGVAASGDTAADLQEHQESADDDDVAQVNVV